MISDSLSKTLKFICTRLNDFDVMWAVTGSLGFVLQGMELPINDIDLQTDKEGAYCIEQCFSSCIIRPFTFSSSDKIQSYFGELRIHDIKVEVMGALQKRLSDGCWEQPVDIRPFRIFVPYQELCIPVLSLQYEYEAYKKLGRFDKAELIRQYLYRKEQPV